MAEKKTAFDSFIEWLKANLYIGVGKSLLLWFLAIAFVPLLAVSVINYLYAYLGLNVVAEKTVVTTSQLRVKYLNTFFRETADFLEVQSELRNNTLFINELKSIKIGFETAEDFVESKSWQNAVESKDEYFKTLLKKEDYYDLYFIDDSGDILYSLKKEKDLGTNIFKGAYAGTLFGKAARQAKETNKILFSDLENYSPSFDLLSGFFIAPLKDGHMHGALIAVQFTTERINNILQDDVGFGETGEAYLVGPDLKMRSASRFEDESVILSKKADTDKTTTWKRYINNKEDEQYLQRYELDIEEVSSYANIRGDYVTGIYRNLDYLENYGVNWALIEEIGNNEAYAYAQELSDIAKISLIVTALLVFLVAILVTRKFVRPIKKLSAWAKQVAIGELVSKKVRAPKNEVGEMVDTFNSLVTSLQSYAEVSQAAALGDYSRSVMIRSENDVLGKSMNQMVQSFRNVVEQSNRIAKGDYSARISPRSEKDSLGISLFEMTRRLRENAREMETQDWLKTGINRLEGKLSGLKNMENLREEIIHFMAEYLGGQVGLFYTADDLKLKLSAGYGINIHDMAYKELKFGQGLAGEAAMQKKMIRLDHPDEDQPGLIDGLNERKIPHFVFSPVIYEDEVLGIIQIGFLKKPEETKMNFLNISLENIAIALNTARSHERVERLLGQTQELANKLRGQQKELQHTNEELEEQTSALKLSEENLKRQQEELRVINEELEERTNDLEIERDTIRRKNEALKDAHREIESKAKDLERASRYKSEFLANMSHELRTPLNSVLVLSQLLMNNKDGSLSDKEIRFAKTIHSSGKDLLELINDILDLSKVESGKLDVQIEDLTTGEIVSFVDNNFRPQLEEKGLYLRIETDEKLPGKISTDSRKLFQIIKNLFSNAIKFTDEGGITFKIFKMEKAAPGNPSHIQSMIALSIIDTGPGIPADKLEHIFEAFRQADGTTNRKYGGTGLGLTISRKFAGLLSGQIKVESELGKGAAFTLFVPEAISVRAIQKKTQTTKSLKKKNETRKYSPHAAGPLYNDLHDDREKIEPGADFVLIIEDDADFSRVLIDLAHEKGFKCMAAPDGETGLHNADYYKPAAIILDIGLPGIDGYEVMEKLKQNPATRHIPVHVVSAGDTPMQALKMGAVDFLTKPVSHEKLEEVFKKIEHINAHPLRKALVVEDEEIMQKSIVNLLNEGNVSIKAVDSGEAAYEILQNEKFECMILDLGLKELSGFELLEKIRRDEKLHNLPVIVYTGQELSRQDDEKLKKYADSIILKGARSFERLLSEASLFLHQVQEEMPANKRKILREINNSRDILNNKKILVVDDDMRNVFALSSLLQEQGVKVITGKNGKEALEKIAEHPDTDLILMDIMMPEMDGYEAIGEIRKKDRFGSLPIVALTAKAMKEDRAKCLLAGANDYLAKPVNTDKLISLLRVWLYNKK